MSKDIKLRQNSLWFFYYKYKDSPYFGWGIISLVISICIILFFQVVIPQVEQWFSIRDEAIRTQQRIDAINSNISFMSKIDRSVLDSQVKTSTEALPTEKSFSAVINALSDSAVASGITLDDFTFQVGRIASVEGQLKVFGTTNLSFVKLTVIVRGSFDAINLFMNEVQQKLPLAEITDVDGDTYSTTITLQFFQKEFPKIVFKDDAPIRSLSNQNMSLLETLTQWQEVEPTEQLEVASGSGAVPLF